MGAPEKCIQLLEMSDMVPTPHPKDVEQVCAGRRVLLPKAPRES